MKAVYRYALNVHDEQEFELTGDPVAFTTQADAGWCEFWAEHNGDLPSRKRAFRVFGTGWPVPSGAKHWGTAPRTGAGLVWHLYEMPTAERPVPAITDWRL